jgi:zinc protease
MKTFLRLAIISATVALAAPHATAQAPAPQQTFNPQDVIPFDSAVRSGTLSNGMKFFIRRNARPENRVTFRLAIKAGSLEEADDQLGLAHLVEHMAFNGSEHFKPGELISYFETYGAQLGPHVNASTGFDQTIYRLELPTDKPDVVQRGLTAMADFAGGLSFIPEEVEKEKGVVIEEWRGGLGAGSRIRDQQLPVLFYQSRYAERLPIGKPDVIRKAPPARVKAFYDTWYRPERMAIIAVGDIDAQQLEAAIRTIFGAIEDRAPATPPANNAIPLPNQVLVSVAADSELTSSSIQLIHKRPKDGDLLVADYRRNLVERLFVTMFDERLSELARKADAKFLNAGVGGGSLGQTASLFSLSARVKDGELAEGLSALAIEARRILEHGFTAPELDRATRSLMASYERAYNERDKSESGQFAQEYVAYFLEEEPSPGIEYEYRLTRSLLPSVTLDEVTQLARSRLTPQSIVVLATSPQKADLRVPTEADLRGVLTSAASVAVTPWTEATIARELVESKPEAAAITARRELPELGVTVVTFANGVDAWFKPTDFKNDQLLFTLYARGGLSLAQPADYFNAAFAARYVGLSGYGGIKALDLGKLLAGKIVSSGPSISLSTHTISGSAAPADLETAMQLLYQQFKAPNDDPDAFALMTRQLEAALANRGQSPGQVFAERVDQINRSNHYTAQPITQEVVRTLDREKMLAFYRERFSNAADFTFFLVGAFDVSQALPLVARYVGTLPSSGTRASDYKNLEIQFPASIVRESVRKGREPRSQTVINFFADPPSDPMEQEKVIAATNVLDTMLRDQLRETLGQTYTVSVGLAQRLPQRGDGYIVIDFGAAPENIAGMTDLVLQAVKQLQQDGPSLDLTSRAKEVARRGYETALKQNGYWMGRLQSVHLLGRDPGEILTRPARIDALTPEVLHDTFKKYFPLDRYTVVTLMPES